MSVDNNISTWTGGKILGALLVLYEKGHLYTQNSDAVILRSFAKKLKETGTLSIRQIDVVRLKISKYGKLLKGASITDVTISVPDGSATFFCSMHNPTSFHVTLPQESPIMEMVKKLHGLQWNPRNFYTCSATKRNGYVLINAGFILHARVHQYMQRTSVALPDYDFSSLNKVIKFPLKDFQRQGIAYLLAHDGKALLADEQGLGKTMQAIGYAVLSNQEKICCVVPGSLKLNWKREISLWAGDDDVFIIQGRTATPQMKKDIKAHKWVIINYDILQSWKPVLAKSGFTLLIFDEAQALKNHKSKRCIYASNLAKKIPHVIALSGTPFENRPIELLPVIQMIDNALFPSRVNYATKFCDLKHTPYADYNGSSNTKELHKLLTETIMIRRKKVDVAKDLPSKTRAVVPVSLSAKASKEYRHAERDFIDFLQQEHPEKTRAAKKATAIVKLGVLKRLAAAGKMTMVMEWLDDYLEHNDKLILFAHHHEILDAISEKYKGRSVIVDGRVSMNKRQGLVDQFQQDPAINLFIGGIVAAGKGYTLTAAKDTVTIELAWTATAHDQCEDRAHRIGQEFPVTAYYLLAESTIEMRIAALLDQKRAMISEVMDGEDVAHEALFTALMKEYKNEGENEKNKKCIS